MAHTKFREARERADVLEQIIENSHWLKESYENNIRTYSGRIENAEPDENLDYETEQLESYSYRLSVFQEVEKMMEKML